MTLNSSSVFATEIEASRHRRNTELRYENNEASKHKSLARCSLSPYRISPAAT